MFIDHFVKAKELKERSLVCEAFAMRPLASTHYFPEKEWLMALSRSLVPAGIGS